MTSAEQDLLAKVAWKENRRGGQPGMTSIINVVLNRAFKHGKTIEQIIMAPYQFTSMSVASDPEYAVDPAKSAGADLAAWGLAKNLSAVASVGQLQDITNGSTMYFSPAGMPKDQVVPYALPDGTMTVFPKHWNQNAVRFVCAIAKQLFFIEV